MRQTAIRTIITRPYFTLYVQLSSILNAGLASAGHHMSHDVACISHHLTQDFSPKTQDARLMHDIIFPQEAKFHCMRFSSLRRCYQMHGITFPQEGDTSVETLISAPLKFDFGSCELALLFHPVL
jgi:hypothetical protein